MVTRITHDNIKDLWGPFTQFRQLFLAERPRSALSHEEIGRLILEGNIVVALSSYGYVLVHTAQQERPVLFLDELFLHRQARKQGHMKELVEWVQGYCIFTGIGQVLMTVYSIEEARVLQSHIGATAHSTMLQVAIPLDKPIYRATYKPPVPIRIGPEKVKRKKKVKLESLVFPDRQPVPESPVFLEQQPVVVMEQESNSAEEPIVERVSGVPPGLVTRDGLVLPMAAERM